MVLRVTYYTILCGYVKALIPKTLLVCCTDNYICLIQIPTTRLHTALSMRREKGVEALQFIHVIWQCGFRLYLYLKQISCT